MVKGDLAQQKKDAFDSLYALDNLSAEEDDPGLAESMQTIKGKIVGDPTVPTPVSKRGRLLQRSASTPHTQLSNHSVETSTNPKRASALQIIDDALLDETEVVKETPIPTLRKSVTFTEGEKLRDSIMPVSSAAPPSSDIPSSSAIPRPMGKRKRGAKDDATAVIKRVPKGQDIFDGLHFCTHHCSFTCSTSNGRADFFPNDDTDQGRRMRIIKALEYGATWQRDWNASITHLIIDQNMKWDNAVEYLLTKGGLPSKQSLVSAVETSTGSCRWLTESARTPSLS